MWTRSAFKACREALYEALENPILFALTYGANFVAQGLTADLDGLAKMIEDGIRYPGFA